MIPLAHSTTSFKSALSTIPIRIDSEIFEKFPQATVACSLIEVIIRSGKQIKNPEAKLLSNYKQDVVKHLIAKGITFENYAESAVCQSWKKVYQTFNVTEKQSTIENLLKRATIEQGKILAGKSADLGKISNFVDIYNCVSIEQMTPMGALDASKIEGAIVLRMGKQGEKFLGLGKNAVEEEVTTDHVVYADDKKILTWLWNYRDAAAACVPNQSEGGMPTYVLLFADQAESSESCVDLKDRKGDAKAAIEAANKKVAEIGGKVLQTFYLSKETPEIEFQIPEQTV